MMMSLMFPDRPYTPVTCHDPKCVKGLRCCYYTAPCPDTESHGWHLWSYDKESLYCEGIVK